MPKMEVDLQPWNVPNFVIAVMPPGKRQDGLKEAPKWNLRDVSAEVLSAQCDKFRAEIFEKAGKVDPKSKDSDNG